MADLFSIDPAPTFTWPVRLTAPGGQARELVVEFRAKTRTDLQAWLEKARSTPPGVEADADSLLEVMAGWRDCAEPFGRDALVRLLDGHYNAASELLAGYLDGLSGARRGN